MRVFVAGASGAIGETLIAELLKQRHSVIGMTTTAAGATSLKSQHAQATSVDALDAAAVQAALEHFRVEAVTDELTSFPKEQARCRSTQRATEE